jgi:hypothetical protein
MRPVAFELMLMTGKDLTSSQPSPSGIDPKFRNELPLARAAKAAEKTKPASHLPRNRTPTVREGILHAPGATLDHFRRPG